MAERLDSGDDINTRFSVNINKLTPDEVGFLKVSNLKQDNDEVESDSMKISGLICKNFNNGSSRVGGDGDLKQYFIDQNKVFISDVDTRAVVRHIRDKGAMNAII